ncbi:MAG: ABC transporter ATP-binding protein [Desulfatibacillaceae bacterium]|nr:ABC transporter ATP-binding protein [Desulfatibacillaceae bacterium]
MLTLSDVTKSFAKTPVLESVSLSVEKGRVLAVLGPSGCGKTTLLRIAAGFEKPDTGSVSIDKTTVAGEGAFVPPWKRGVSMVFQELALWPHMSVEKHLRFVLKGLRKAAAEEKIVQVLEQTKLLPLRRRYPAHLSGGERQRLALARALVTQPGYLLMDEPLSNLDIILKREILALIRQLVGAYNTGVIYVTHNLDEAKALGDSIAIMDKARVVQQGLLEVVLAAPENGFVRSFLQQGV